MNGTVSFWENACKYHANYVCFGLYTYKTFRKNKHKLHVKTKSITICVFLEMSGTKIRAL